MESLQFSSTSSTSGSAVEVSAPARRSLSTNDMHTTVRFVQQIFHAQGLSIQGQNVVALTKPYREIMAGYSAQRHAPLERILPAVTELLTMHAQLICEQCVTVAELAAFLAHHIRSLAIRVHHTIYFNIQQDGEQGLAFVIYVPGLVEHGQLQLTHNQYSMPSSYLPYLDATIDISRVLHDQDHGKYLFFPLEVKNVLDAGKGMCRLIGDF